MPSEMSLIRTFQRLLGTLTNLPFKLYEGRRPKHEPVDSHFYLARQLSNCMMIYDGLNSHVYPVRTEMIATKHIPTFHVCSTDERKLKYFLVNETLLHICSMDKDESKGSIVDEFSTEEDESEYVHKYINKQKDAKNEADYEEYSVTDKVPIYFNIFECGKNIFNRLDVTYERSCMATPKDKYYTKLLETVIDYNYHHNAPSSNENL